MADGLISGFERRRLPGRGLTVDALIGGGGPPLLLLHGYPQTRLAWREVAPELAAHFTVVVPDLRGYGRSDKPAGDDRHELYAKRTMALDQIATMQALGYDRFAVAGHDRGARVAYRLALDHPERVTHVAVLDIVPTVETWEAMTADAAMRSFHWLMLAQPQPVPETLIGGHSDFFFRHLMTSWAAKDFRFDPDSMEDYLACLRDPASIHATCEDYRAGWSRDREHDEADRGRKKIAAPLLTLWGDFYGVAKAKPLEAWARWADRVSGRGVPGGHFVAEEAPEETTKALLAFFQTD